MSNAVTIAEGARGSLTDWSEAEALGQQIEAMQRELDSLREEVHLLRQRDVTLNTNLSRIDEELRLAARLQQDFLPRALPRVGGVCFHTLFRPAGHVSGDLYDVMRLDETHIGFYMVDAVGHGMPAALLTMFLKRALVTKQITPGGYRLRPPAEVMADLNQAMIEQELPQSIFATALYGMIDMTSGAVRLSRGGHPNPLLLGGDGGVRAVECAGSLLGVFPGESFSEASLTLQPGERLLIHSDGLELALAGNGTDTRQWRRELERRSGLGSEQLLAEIDQQLTISRNCSELQDDLALILVERP